jgi:predicted phage replisome organizer
MKRLQWLKIKVGFYSDPRMVRMLRQPNGETYHLVLSVLRDFAGAINRGGWVYVTEQEPLTSKDLGHYLHRRTKTMDKALDCLEELEFIRRTETGIIQLMDWDDMQGCDKEQVRREQTRQRVAKCRQRQKEDTEAPPTVSGGPDSSGMTEATTEPDIEVVDIDTVIEDTDSSDRSQDSEDSSKDASSFATVQHHVASKMGTLPTRNQRWQERACLQKYQQYFGQIGAACAHRLLELERDWGTEALSNALDIAYDNHVPNVKYIQAVLVNGNGKSKRKESREDERIQRYAAMLESCVRESDESVKSVCGDSTKVYI